MYVIHVHIIIVWRVAVSHHTRWPYNNAIYLSPGVKYSYCNGPYVAFVGIAVGRILDFRRVIRSSGKKKKKKLVKSPLPKWFWDWKKKIKSKIYSPTLARRFFFFAVFSARIGASRPSCYCNLPYSRTTVIHLPRYQPADRSNRPRTCTI